MHYRREGVFGRIAPAIIVLGLGLSNPSRLLGQDSYDITDLGTFGGNTSVPGGINDFGQISGQADFAGGGTFLTNHAFLYSNGGLNDLGVLSVYTTGAGSLSRSWGTGINNLGQVVGYSYTSNGSVHAFLYGQGQMTDLGTLVGDQQSKAMAISTNGQVVGVSGAAHAFLYDISTMTMTSLGTLGGNASFAYSINNSGVIVGDSSTNVSGLSDVAFVYSNGIMSTLPNVGNWPAINAYAINDNGQITGYAGTVNTGGPYVSHGFVYSGGTMTDLGNLGGPLTNVTPSAINNKGQIVGVASGYQGPLCGFIYSGGSMTDLSTAIDPASGWTIIRAVGINNNGEIIVYAKNMVGLQHALLLTPRPVLKNLHFSGGLAQFALFGTTGFAYRVDFTPTLPATNWNALTNIFLTTSPTQLVDPSATAAGQRYYRAFRQ
jgi:probable HAF family extracellular repeat protein